MSGEHLFQEDVAGFLGGDCLEAGKNSAHLVNLLTTTMIASKPFERGRSVMKSTLMEVQGASGTFKGSKSPAGLELEGFFLEHERQCLTCSFTDFLRPVQLKWCLIKEIVPDIPGCLASMWL